MGRAFIIAVQFLSRFPTFSDHEWQPRAVGRSQLFYPVVGLMIGLSLLLVAWISSGTSDWLQAGLVLTAWVLITGGLHLDGLADSADAWVGGLGDKERTLAIMKDPYCGPSAVVALVLVLLLKFVALTSLIAEAEWMTILFIPVLARASLAVLFLTTPYVREGGLGEWLMVHMPRKQLQWVLVGTALLCLLMLGGAGFLMVLATLLFCYLLRRLMLQRIGGMTGDTAGASVELVELGLLLLVVVF